MKICSSASLFQRSTSLCLAVQLLQRCSMSKLIPKSPRVPIFGSLPYFLAAGGATYFHKYIDKMHKKLGPVFIENFDGSNLYFISDSNLNKEVYRAEGKYPIHFIPEAWSMYQKETGRKRGIFFMDGQEWHKNRIILNNVLLKDKETSFTEVLSPIVDDFLSILKTRNPGDDLELLLYNWNIECQGSLFFGKRMGFLDRFLIDKKNDFAKENFVKSVHDIFLTSSRLATFPPKIAKKLNLKIWKNFYHATTSALDQGEEHVASSIREYQSNPNAMNNETLLKNLLDQSMDGETIKKIIVDLFLAAGDTTSQTTMWILYLLGKHPDVTEVVRDEVNAIVRDAETITAEHVDSLPLLRAVIKESMRLYPVAPFLTRKIVKDVSAEGYELPKEALVATSLYTMGRDGRYFYDANKFIPQRWLDDQEKLIEEAYHSDLAREVERISRTTEDVEFFPFGTGARTCIGRRIAEGELMTLLAKMLLNLRWTTKDNAKMVLRMVGVPLKPIKFDITLLK